MKKFILMSILTFTSLIAIAQNRYMFSGYFTKISQYDPVKRDYLEKYAEREPSTIFLDNLKKTILIKQNNGKELMKLSYISSENQAGYTTFEGYRNGVVNDTDTKGNYFNVNINYKENYIVYIDELQTIVIYFRTSGEF